MYASWVAVLCLAAVVRAAPGMTDCVHDNCLRAVLASAFMTRSVTADCSSYFETTVTPATSTITATASLTATVTATDSVTTTIVTTTLETDVITSLIIVTDTVLVTNTLPATTTVVVMPRKRNDIGSFDRGLSETTLAARQITVEPSNIPSYASACSGSVRYSSACSCIGITGSTSTAPTPMTTVTITNTVTATTTATSIQTTSSTETDILLTTTTSTTTTTAPACTYSLAYSNSDCAYNHYKILQLLDTSDSTKAFQECSAICDADPTCVEISFDFVTPEGAYECSTDDVLFLGVGETQQYFGQCYSYNKICGA